MGGLTFVARRQGVDLLTGMGSACGTFGELLQGALPAHTGIDDFLVTFPVARRSRAWFRLEPDGPLRVFPSHKQKSGRLVATLLAAHGGGLGGTLLLESDIAVGKGLASSSADLVATARAVGSALGLDTGPAAIEDWLRPIEPTDGVMHPGVVLFEHRKVRLAQSLGVLPALTIVAVDEGGQIDTVAFNRQPKRYSSQDRAIYGELLEQLAAGLRAGDLSAVGTAATRSAVLNQRLQPKRLLEPLLRICAAEGGLGVVCAHSGTMLGILLADADPDHRSRLARVLTRCAALAGPAAVSVFHSYPHQETESGLAA